jgi:N-acetyl sugar amidotransferase
MKYCKKCVMPDTKPGIVFDDQGVCMACRASEKRKETDWTARYKELEKLADKYRGCNGDYYDCIIPVSGGKDSHYQAYIFKEKLGMNPLLVSVTSLFSMTKAGQHNFLNMSDAFGCDMHALYINRREGKKMIRAAFEEFGSPTWIMDRAIYAFPIKTAVDLNIPLVVYGENVSYEYGGFQTKETPSATSQINNTVAKNIDLEVWEKKGVPKKTLNAVAYPSKEEIEKAKLDPVYLSYYLPWDGYENYQLAKKYGFQNLGDEWKREGYIEDYDQIDTPGYLVHAWMKYPKFGFARATDVGCYWIRSGKITRDKAIDLVKEHDHKLDKVSLKDFRDFTGYNEKEFWNVVDKFWNRDIFEQKGDAWILKNPIWEQ